MEWYCLYFITLFIIILEIIYVVRAVILDSFSILNNVPVYDFPTAYCLFSCGWTLRLFPSCCFYKYDSVECFTLIYLPHFCEEWVPKEDYGFECVDGCCLPNGCTHECSHKSKGASLCAAHSNAPTKLRASLCPGASLKLSIVRLVIFAVLINWKCCI